MSQAPPLLEISTLQTDDWEEANFLATLARLERLQNQLDKARMIPQNIIHTLHEPHDTPAEFAAAFIESARNCSKALDNLKRTWEEPNTSLLLRRCVRTADKHTELAMQSGLGIWGWEEREAEMKSKKAREAEKPTLCNTLEDEEKAIEELGAQFEKCDWEDEKKTRLSAVVARPGISLEFEVKRRATREGIVYDVECIGDMKELEGISRSIHKRKSRQNIYETLEMLLAYGDKELRQADCAKCGQYRDRKGSLPSARRIQTKPKAGGRKNEEEAVWVALHENCL